MAELRSHESYAKQFAEFRRKAISSGVGTGITSFRLERHTNRHPTTSGRLWGWYEVFPLHEVVGHWEDGGKDDLRAVDIEAWNKSAKVMCD